MAIITHFSLIGQSKVLKYHLFAYLLFCMYANVVITRHSHTTATINCKNTMILLIVQQASSYSGQGI